MTCPPTLNSPSALCKLGLRDPTAWISTFLSDLPKPPSCLPPLSYYSQVHFLCIPKQFKDVLWMLILTITLGDIFLRPFNFKSKLIFNSSRQRIPQLLRMVILIYHIWKEVNLVEIIITSFVTKFSYWCCLWKVHSKFSVLPKIRISYLYHVIVPKKL